MLTLLFFNVFIGVQVVAISSNFIIGDSKAHMQKRNCAYYILSGLRVDNIEWFSSHHNHQSVLTESALDYKATSCDSGDSRYSFAPPLTALIHSLPHDTLIGKPCLLPNQDRWQH